MEFEAKSEFEHKTSKIKSHSARVSKLYLNDKTPIHGKETALIFRFSAEKLELDLAADLRAYELLCRVLFCILGALESSIRERTNVTFGLYFSLYEWFNPTYVKDKNNDFETQDYVEVS